MCWAMIIARPIALTITTVLVMALWQEMRCATTAPSNADGYFLAPRAMQLYLHRHSTVLRRWSYKRR